MGIKLLNCTALTGGGSRALDSYPQAAQVHGNRAHTAVAADNNKFFVHVYDSTRTDAENSPGIIRPNDYAGPGVWVMTSSPYGDIAVVPEIVSGLPIEGGISGGDITRTSDHVLTISPMSCLSSDLTTQLYAATSETITIPTVANTIYHIFRVKLVADGSMEYRAYTTEAAVASDAQVSKYRWIGFWRTNGSSNLVVGAMVGELLIFGKGSENVATSSISTSFAAVDHSSMVPASRISEIEYGVRSGTADINAESSIDGTNVDTCIGVTISSGADTNYHSWGNGGFYKGSLIPFLSGRFFRAYAGSCSLLVHKVRVRR